MYAPQRNCRRHIESEPLNPVDLERAINEISNQIARGVDVITGAERTSVRARREYDVARALAYARTSGTVKDREMAVLRATDAEREAAEDAEITFRHAQRTAAALDRRLSALQAIAKLVNAMYGAVRT